MALLRFDKVSFAYPNAAKKAVDNVSLSVDAGEFVLLMGASGCGKTTFIRQAKPALAPAGTLEGQIYYAGKPLSQLASADAAREIGFVQQDPDAQIVTDYVWHELAFGLECLGQSVGVIRRRVAEMAAFFGMESIFRSKTCELSGGQKQLLNLAGTLAMDPKLLILDEPTAMLDPLAARELLDAVSRINKELGVAVLMCEHRLEQAFTAADSVAVMENGRIICSGSNEAVAAELSRNAADSRAFYSMNAPVKIFAGLGTAKLPLTVRDARARLKAALADYLPVKEAPAPAPKAERGNEALNAKELWFRYDENGQDVLRGCDITLNEGQLLCLLGGNGAGKSTLLGCLCALKKPYRGKVKLAKGKRLCLLPQNARSLFVADTVAAELLDGADGDAARAEDMAQRLELGALMAAHPYDLSGGETERLALGKLLLRRGDVLLLDEPTKGLDAYAKHELAALLKGLCARGAAILLVTHDIDFAAQYADECAMMFDGGIISRAEPHEFFAGNRFYTTDANRIAADMLPGCITSGEVIAKCKSILG